MTLAPTSEQPVAFLYPAMQKVRTVLRTSKHVNRAANVGTAPGDATGPCDDQDDDGPAVLERKHLAGPERG